MRKLLLILPVLFASCSNNETPADKKDSTRSGVVKTDTASDWHSLAESWTASLNMKNASIMRSFYADTVTYYGDRIAGTDVVNRQSAYFVKNADYKQKITEYIGEEQQPDGTWRVRITKQVTAGGKTADYPASLIFSKQNGVWKIITESDDISDLNKARTIAAHYAPEKVTVEGLLEETTGFGKVEGGDPKSDAKQNYYIIWPSSKLDVSGAGQPEEKGVDKIQVEGDAATIKAMLNKKVSMTGTLKHGDDKHFTKVVITAEKIEEVK